MDASSHFRGKRITLMGLGLLGRGIGDARYLAECGAELTVTDLKTKEELADSLKELEAFPNIHYTLGGHNVEDFQNKDLIVKAASVPLKSPFIAEAKKNGIPVRMSADLFAEYAGVSVVGVTGTRGKTTTAFMIVEIMKAAGMKVLLGGNVRGISTLALLNDVHGDEVAVLELDSWQLQGFGEAHLSPSIAVFTTFFSDHLNYYKDDLAAYLTDKANIFFYQQEGDTLVLGSQCAPIIIEKFGEAIESDIVIADDTKLPADWKLSIPGIHNRYNAGLALATARTLDISDEVSKKALESFAGVAGRLEFVREINGVKFYNDTTATTPEATLAALRAVGTANHPNIVLIMGGADKGLGMDGLLHELSTYVKHMFFISGTGTDRIRAKLPAVEIYSSLEKAVAIAQATASSGDVVLFSPAFSSFGMFKNEYDRGDQFTKIVTNLV